MTNTAPAQVFSAREAIRVALADLALAYDRKETRGVSGAEMARACGVSPQSFGRYLSGERVFPLDHLPLLERVLADNRVDEAESAQLRASYMRVVSEALEGFADLSRGSEP